MKQPAITTKFHAVKQHYIATLVQQIDGKPVYSDVNITANSVEHALDRADFIAEFYDNCTVDRVRTRVMHHHVSPSTIISEVK